MVAARFIRDSMQNNCTFMCLFDLFSSGLLGIAFRFISVHFYSPLLSTYHHIHKTSLQQKKTILFIVHFFVSLVSF